MLTRRDFLQFCLGTLAAANPLAFGAEQTRPGLRCRPLISGALWQGSAQACREWGADEWRRELDEQRNIGFDLLWLSQAVSLMEAGPFSLKQLLDLCEQRRVKVILDTGSSGLWYASLDVKKEIAFCRKNIRAIGERFAGHPAFHAWYVPHEIYMTWGALDDYVKGLYPALTEACKTAARLPVTLSPFFILDRTKVFGDFRFNEPDEYRQFWAKLIRRSGFDAIMLQDSGEHFSYVTIGQRKPFFEAMSQACKESGARFWANVEVAEMECPSLEEYVRRYGRVHHSAVKQIPWRVVPIGRLKEKLHLAAQYAEKIVGWGYQEYGRPDLGPPAAAWYRSYRQYFTQLNPG